MAKYKELLIPNRIVEAGRKRKCYHSRKHQIEKGNICVEVKDGMAWKGYCAACAAEMFKQARARVQSAISELETKG